MRSRSMRKVADKRCENGHIIDESWDLCPYCPALSGKEIPVIVPNRSRTSEGSAPASSRPPSVAVPREVARSHEPRSQTSVRIESPQSTPERTVSASKIDPLQLAARRYVVGWLIGITGSVRGESYPIRIGRNILGRDRKSDIVINDEQASAHHADLVFRLDEKRFILMDHNSTNGTYVNEEEIEPRRDLQPHDEIRIASLKYFFFPLCSETFCWDDEGQLK